MKEKTLIFMRPFTSVNPTLDEQNAFMFSKIMVQGECRDLGRFYDNDALYGKDIPSFIREEIKARKPEWIIADGKCATAALSLHRQKKILINPKVTFDNLNNVPDFARQNTFGFFGEEYEADYERFQSVYPHAAFYPATDNLSLLDIKEIAKEIIEGSDYD